MKISKLFPIIGIILFVYIIWSIGVSEIIVAFKLIPPHLFLLALLIFIPRLFLSAFRWKYICKKQKINVSYFYLMRISLISLFYGGVTPATVGSHIRILYLKERSNASLEKCITSSLLDAVMAFISGLLIALIGSVILLEQLPGLFPIILVFFLFYLSLFVLLMKHERGSKFYRYIIKPFIPARFKDSIRDSVDSLYEDLPSIKDMLFIPLIVSILILILASTQVYIISLAFSVDIPYLVFICVSIISVVAATIPVSVGGLGVREGVLVLVLGVYGFTPEAAFVISLSGFLVKTLIPGVFGLAISFKGK